MADANPPAGSNVADQGNKPQRAAYDYGGNPLARADTSDTTMLPAFGGAFQPGLFRQVKDSRIANPAPLGLSAFALTTFVLSLLNIGVRGVKLPYIVIGPAFGYGGLVQLLAGMWEMAVGNTFGATALSSYGGFWISFAIIFTPGGFQVEESYISGTMLTGEAAMTEGTSNFYTAFSYYLFGWFIFTFLMLVCTLRSTIAFFFLFLTLDLAFLCLAIGYLDRAGPTEPNAKLVKAGGYFGIFSAFAAWYNAIAGILDRSNSFVLIPVAHFPWSEKGKERRGKATVASQENGDVEKQS